MSPVVQMLIIFTGVELKRDKHKKYIFYFTSFMYWLSSSMDLMTGWSKKYGIFIIILFHVLFNSTKHNFGYISFMGFATFHQI